MKKLKKLPLQVLVARKPGDKTVDIIMLEENFIHTIKTYGLRIMAEKLRSFEWAAYCRLPQDSDLDEGAGVCDELADAVKAAICVRVLRASASEALEARRIAEEERRLN